MRSIYFSAGSEQTAHVRHLEKLPCCPVSLTLGTFNLCIQREYRVLLARCITRSVIHQDEGRRQNLQKTPLSLFLGFNLYVCFVRDSQAQQFTCFTC